MPSKPTGRPRGRPPGAKNKPKTIEQFVLGSLDDPIAPPTRRPKRQNHSGPWSTMTPEQRSALGRKLADARKSTANQQPGKPSHLTKVQWAEVMATAKLDARRIIQKMKDAGQFPDDPRAAEALTKAVETLRAANSPKDVAALGRLILDFTKAKPAQKIEATIKSAEDILDEMGEDDG